MIQNLKYVVYLKNKKTGEFKPLEDEIKFISHKDKSMSIRFKFPE